MDAMVYASQDIINFDVLWKMFLYSLSWYKDAEAAEFYRQVLDFSSFEQRQEALSKFVEGYPKDMFSIFY